MHPHRKSASCAAWLACIAAACIGMASVAQASHPGTVELSPLPLDRTQAVPSLAVLGLNSSILSDGSLAFLGGYDAADWSGVLKAQPLNADGSFHGVLWDAGGMLTDPVTTSPIGRTVLSASKDELDRVAGIAFESNARLDADETRLLMEPAPAFAADTLATRIDYLRGVRVQEGDGTMRVRQSLLGAIVHAQAVYVGRPSGRTSDTWPTHIHGVSVSAPELQPAAQRYAQFVEQQARRMPMLYVAANDGMLHAFQAPVPTCKTHDGTGGCTAYNSDTNAGKEAWAYVPRAVYGALGNLTRAQDFQFQPTVDATPVTRDVYFSQQDRHEWHTLLAGGVRLGGRGVYALDITHAAASEVWPKRTVKWEFDADAAPGTSAAGGAYQPADLGYTYGQPAIARLANGRWAVLMPSGYFPDCRKPDKPLRCEESEAQAPMYSALFVLDAQTGEVIAELKTPASIEGVTSYGLTTPVLGDYDNNQIDDVAFAGDLAGNLWRFDLSSPNPANWTVTLAYRPAVQGAQPITVMPRLFPDPATNRFVIVFGTGKYLGDADKSDTTMQSIYGIRDKRDSGGRPVTVTQDSLQAQTLSEAAVASPADPEASASMRSLTSNAVPITAGGWHIDLDLIAGERVIVTVAALFNTNTALVSTLVPHGDHPYGALMAIDAATGGARSILSVGGVSYAGALVETAQTAGTLPTIVRMGGGKLVLPGVKLKGGKDGLDLPLSLDSPLWRRRSWSVLTPDN